MVIIHSKGVKNLSHRPKHYYLYWRSMKSFTPGLKLFNIGQDSMSISCTTQHPDERGNFKQLFETRS